MTLANDIRNASPAEMVDVLFATLSWFKDRGLGNPFNYNRAFEYIQSGVLGYEVTTVGGGSDGINADGDTAEFKGTEYKGTTKKGTEKAHSFTYNGTTRKDTIEEQRAYCRDKVMRDRFHYWTIFDYENGRLVKTFKLTGAAVWSLIWPKWEHSFHNPGADPRIGGSISTTLLESSGVPYEVIDHS